MNVRTTVAALSKVVPSCVSCTDMIIDNDPPITRHISVPRDMSQLSCSSFSAGVVEAVLDGLGFVSDMIIAQLLVLTKCPASPRVSPPTIHLQINTPTVPRFLSSLSNQSWTVKKHSKRRNCGDRMYRCTLRMYF